MKQKPIQHTTRLLTSIEALNEVNQHLFHQETEAIRDTAEEYSSSAEFNNQDD